MKIRGKPTRQFFAKPELVFKCTLNGPGCASTEPVLANGCIPTRFRMFPQKCNKMFTGHF